MDVVCNSSKCVASFDITFLMFGINFVIIVNYEETYENFNLCCTDGTNYPHFMDVSLCQNARLDRIFPESLFSLHLLNLDRAALILQVFKWHWPYFLIARNFSWSIEYKIVCRTTVKFLGTFSKFFYFHWIFDLRFDSLQNNLNLRFDSL